MSLSNYWNNNYNATGQIEQSPFTRELHDKIIELIPSNPQNILDVGCGSGVLLNKIRNINKHTVTGTDLSEEAVRIVNEKLKLECFVGSITNLKVEDNSYDTIICSEVIEHLYSEDLEKAFSELVRVSKDRIIISTPYLENLEYHQTKCSKCKTLFHPAGHIREIDESFFIPYIQKYTTNYSFYYTGKRPPRYKTYSVLSRLFSNYIIWLDNLECPICNIKIEKKKLSFSYKVIMKGYQLLQKFLLVCGLKKFNNIILVLNLK